MLLSLKISLSSKHTIHPFGFFQAQKKSLKKKTEMEEKQWREKKKPKTKKWRI